MRQSPIRDLLAAAGARFGERDGLEVPLALGDPRTEYDLVRNGTALTDMSHLQKYRSADEEAIYFLDDILAANVANIRYGRVLHTFLASESGEIVSDVYVASNEEEILVLCESCVPDAEVDALLLGEGSPLENVTAELAVFSLDGAEAYGVPRDLFSPDILGMPYLSVEDQELDGEEITLVRAGKTSEFGYLVVCPRDRAAAVWERLVAAGEQYGLGLCGLDVHDTLKLDGRFFNINREGRAVKDPLSLGLQWMIDFEKERFVGRAPILERRAQGLTRKIVGISRTEPGPALQVGDALLLDGEPAGELITVGYSHALDREVGLALLNVAVAYAGLELAVQRDGADVDVVTSVSMPPIMPKSLTVKLDEL